MKRPTLKGATPAEEEAYLKADSYRAMVARRTGLKPEELQCPREKSSMTPCIARDGRLAVAFNARNYPICVGCEHGLNHLFKEEEAKQIPSTHK